MIALHQELFDLADGDTVIVFGHGPNGRRADLLRMVSQDLQKNGRQ